MSISWIGRFQYLGVLTEYEKILSFKPLQLNSNNAHKKMLRFAIVLLKTILDFAAKSFVVMVVIQKFLCCEKSHF